ncbi:Esterase/hydrolase [Labilithrix luteola]|uniref:Esterase/hydrolase n=1 Tax=Labilithrix luteola TaxID=1391654 RepID=A0A0K1Q6R7_9BACT|nr:Esterase/hydrolase [Labilithrix luteola]
MVIHGIAGDATRWTTVRSRLSAKYTLFAMDRRGRGASGDSSAYSIAREAEDVMALVDAIGEDVFLLGHSFGGVVALEASSRLVTREGSPRPKKLVVYEPFVPPAPVAEASPLMREYLALAETGDREVLVLRFLREIVQMSDAEIGRLRSHSSWPARVAAAPTIAREMAAIERHRFDPTPLVVSGLPIRMLLGQDSPTFLREASTRLASMLPASQIVELLQQKHIAMDTAPELFVREVSSFFEA